MYYESHLHFLRKILDNCHLQNLIINPEDVLDERIDRDLRKLYTNGKSKETFFDFFSDIIPKTIYRVTDVFLCRYIFFELPLCEEKKVFIIGPYINFDISQQQILEQGEKMGISPKLFNDLKLYYSSLPVIKEEKYIFAMVNSFAEYLWNGSDNFQSADINRENSAAFIHGQLELQANEEYDILSADLMEKRYDFENELINAVSQGNVHKAEQMMASFSTLAFENRTPDKLRNMKNYCIIMNTLLRKAAENGGVHPIYIDSVSSDFAKRIENIQSEASMPNFMLEILRTYCRLVRQHSIKNYSPLVKKTIIKIESDLTENLSLTKLASLNNVSPSYLSAIFKKETGHTLTEYVNTQRIKQAKHLLKTTSLQIQTIAQHCGILDLHYFCRIFKNATGKTPSEYRNSIF